jgi:hypothetical protein
MNGNPLGAGGMRQPARRNGGKNRKLYYATSKFAVNLFFGF